MATETKVEANSGGQPDRTLDPVSISARLLNLILEMPVERQLDLLCQLDNGNCYGTRKHPRKKVSLPVELEIDHHTFEEATTDISKGGLYIETQTSFAVNHSVKLSILLPNRPKPIALLGEIVRSTPRGIGIRFRQAG